MASPLIFSRADFGRRLHCTACAVGGGPQSYEPVPFLRNVTSDETIAWGRLEAIVLDTPTTVAAGVVGSSTRGRISAQTGRVPVENGECS